MYSLTWYAIIYYDEFLPDGRVFVQIEWWESDDDIRDVLPTFLICWLGSELENDIIGNKLSMDSRTIEYSMKERRYWYYGWWRKIQTETTNLELRVADRNETLY